tara:strand:+ start:347 stop:1513 length:1167 start_codon:yes stop_codon:yes gene_type:complete
VKVTKSQLKELIRHTIVDLTEKTFGSKAQYDAYRKKHNLKPGSKHKVDGKTVTVRDTKKMSKKAKSLGDKMADKLNKRMADLEKKRKQGKSVFDKKNTMQQPFFKISYTDSEGRKKTDSMRAKTSGEAKKDFINMNKGRGFKVVKVQKESVNESKKRRFTVKEVRMWMKKLEENRYKKVYNSDARRVAWMVNNEGVSLDEMPISMKKKWTKAQYGRERYLATEFLKSKSEQMNEGKLNETKFIAFYKSKKVTINAKSLYDAKKQIIDKLKVPKKDYGIVSVLNKTEYDKQQFRFEQKLRKSIREIIKEQLNEAYRSQSIFFDKKDKSKLEKLLKKNKGKFPFNPPGESVVNWSITNQGSKGLEWRGIPKSKYDKAVEFFMKNKLNPRG